MKKNFTDQLNNPDKMSPTLYLSLEEFEIKGKILLSCFVPCSSTVVKCNGRIYDRNEDGDMDITDSPIQVENMYARKIGAFNEHKIFPYVEDSDLRFDLLPQVRRLIENKNSEHEWLKMSDKDLYTRLTIIFEKFKKVTLDIPEEFYKLIIFCVLCTYLLFKGLIVLTAGAKKKILPTLLIVIQILLCFIIQDKNLAFVLAINFLLIYVFQQLCEFSKKSVKIKFIIYFAILALLLLFFFAQGIVATLQAAT